MFRADLVGYKGSGQDCGHLVVWANQRETELQNNETFQLSNTSPQKDQFDQNIWLKLGSEQARSRNTHSAANIPITGAVKAATIFTLLKGLVTTTCVMREAL